MDAISTCSSLGPPPASASIHSGSTVGLKYLSEGSKPCSETHPNRSPSFFCTSATIFGARQRTISRSSLTATFQSELSEPSVQDSITTLQTLDQVSGERVTFFQASVALQAAIGVWYGAWDYSDSDQSVWPVSAKRNLLWQVFGILAIMASDLMLEGARIDDNFGIEALVWARFETKTGWKKWQKWLARFSRASLDITGQIMLFIGGYDMFDSDLWPQTYERDILYCTLGVAIAVLATCCGRWHRLPKAAVACLATLSLVANNAISVGNWNFLTVCLAHLGSTWQFGFLGIIVFIVTSMLYFCPQWLAVDAMCGVPLETLLVIAEVTHFNAAYILFGHILKAGDPLKRVIGMESIEDAVIFIISLAVLWGMQATSLSSTIGGGRSKCQCCKNLNAISILRDVSQRWSPSEAV